MLDVDSAGVWRHVAYEVRDTGDQSVRPSIPIRVHSLLDRSERKHSPLAALSDGDLDGQAGGVAGTGGCQGLPVMTLRSTVRTSWPCLRAVSM